MSNDKRKKDHRINPDTGLNERQYEGDDLWTVKGEGEQE